jgi:hypothetical protein
MPELIEYKPGTAFPGKIGQAQESSPARLQPKRAKRHAPVCNGGRVRDLIEDDEATFGA